MGLTYAAYANLIDLFPMGSFPSVCMMGMQKPAESGGKNFLEYAKESGIYYDDSLSEELLREDKIDTVKLFKMFGFKKVSALDCDSFEGADIIFDLNDELPDDLNESFDLIVDGGTLEHIINPIKAIDNMSAMVKENGYIYHSNPVYGMVNHGFYSFSPSFYRQYYLNKGFEIKDIRIMSVNPSMSESGQCFSADLRLLGDDETINSFINNFRGNGSYGVICVLAKKSKRQEKKVINLSQEVYRRAYDNSKKEIKKEEAIKLLKSESGVVLYGGGYYCEEFLDFAIKNGLEENIKFIFDSNAKKSGTTIRGIKVKYPTKERVIEEACIIITNRTFQDEIYNSLIDAGVNKECIYRISAIW